MNIVGKEYFEIPVSCAKRRQSQSRHVCKHRRLRFISVCLLLFV